MTDLLILFAIVLAVNLMPAFGPPTWTVIVLYGLNTNIGLPLLVLTGALAAATGRLLLAYAFRLFGHRLPAKIRGNLDAAREALERNKRNAAIALALFALSPIPSAQLFEAAGLAGVRLIGFTAAFFAGRLVSYSLFGLAAQRVRETSMGEALKSGFTSPAGIAMQLVMIGLLILLARLDWARILGSGKR
ncbi:MAG TPA: hypothetical protein VF662_02625 [Allosphingosinicella sp.]|jgi:uncharacterized membrane protein YdjX (TVP38/TMEM64 family)